MRAAAATRRSTRPRAGALAGAAGAALLVGAALAGAPTRAPLPASPTPRPVAASGPAADCAAAVVAGMTLEQRVGQLFVAGADAAAPTSAQLAMVTDEHLGGVVLTGRSSAGVAATRGVTDALRARSGGAVTGGVGLWVSTDQEGGAVQVLSGPGFSPIPTALAQGALAPAVLRADAAVWGGQLRAAGVDLDLAPVLDTVPADLGTRNRPIGFYAREYAHTPAGVSASGTAFAAGLRDAGVQATAKHFPGLGRVLDNTDTTAGVTDTVTVRGDAYLQPFADAVRGGIPVVMVSSAVYSRIDPASIATFSPVVIGSVLRGDLGFGGVVVSDSLGAAALASTAVADRAVRFIAAGGTVALAAESGIVPEMVGGVLARARADAAFAGQVDAAARSVVAAKEDAGLVSCPAATAAIAARYAALGGSSSVLGAPVGAQRSLPGGAVQDYRNGSIYWSPATGAHEVHGAILGEYAAAGGPTGFLGYPVTDEQGVADGVGRVSTFTGGGILFTVPTGAHEVHGAIGGHYRELGGPTGFLGYPVTDEQGVADGVGRVSTFTGGGIWFTVPTGAHEVHGAIGGGYRAVGGPTGVLGYPVTDELGNPDGVGRRSNFAGAGGASIYFTPATGAHDVYGAIWVRWGQQGWEQGPLGYPVGDEHAVPGGLRCDFQGGSLTSP